MAFDWTTVPDLSGTTGLKSPGNFGDYWNPKGDSAGYDWGDAFKYKPTSKAKDFLETFSKALGSSDDSKYRSSLADSQQGGRQTPSEISNPFVSKIAPDVSIYTPQAFSPFTVAGVQGKQGFGGAIGKIAGTAIGALIGGPAGATLGGSLGGTAGGFFG